jgi:hypothetical protein
MSRTLKTAAVGKDSGRSGAEKRLKELGIQLSAPPVGFRMALVHPERIEALIVQDAVAHNEGLGRIGKHAGPSGLTALPMRTRCAQIFYRSRPRARAI